MPTGYTYPVVEGKIVEFHDFAMLCARAFGALITMRDDSMDEPIPDEIKPNTSYHDEQIASDLRIMGDIQRMSNADAEAAAIQAHVDAMASRAEYLKKQSIETERLNSMLAKVRAWEPPTPDHLEMKRFMMNQLVMSLPGKYVPAIPELLDGKTWRQREIDRLAKSMVYHQTERAKEIDRAAGRTAWLKALRSSLSNHATHDPTVTK